MLTLRGPDMAKITPDTRRYATIMEPDRQRIVSESRYATIRTDTATKEIQSKQSLTGFFIRIRIDTHTLIREGSLDPVGSYLSLSLGAIRRYAAGVFQIRWLQRRRRRADLQDFDASFATCLG